MNRKYANAIRKVQNMMTALGKDEFECDLFDALAAQLKRLHHFYYTSDDRGANKSLVFVEKDNNASEKDIARFVEIFG